MVRVAGGLIDGALCGIVKIHRESAQDTVFPRTGGNDDVPLYGHGQHKPVIVVRVFTDDIDPPRRPHHGSRRFSKMLLKGFRCMLSIDAHDCLTCSIL